MAEKQAGGLSLRIGLTLSQLQSDFLAAEQTVKQGIAALNRQQNIVKLKMQTDLSGLDLAADRAKILEVQERSLTQLLEMQRDKLTLATRAYQEYANSKGVNAAGAKNLETAMEKERLAVARLEEQLKSLSSQKISLDTSRLQEKIAKINAKINNVKLKAEIDTSQLSGATAAFDSQKIHIAAVTRELELQRQKLIQLREALHSSIKNTGVGSVQSLNIKSNVLQQVQEINRLESKLKELRNTDIKLQIRADSLKQAESQINENIARLNARLENIRVKAEIDTSKLSASASEFDKAKVHVQGLTRELELQKQKLAELQKAMYTSAKTNGVGNVKTINLNTDIQRQIQEINQLKAKIEELNKIQPPKTNSLLSGYLNIKGDITGKLNEIANSFNQLQGATASVDSAITSTLGVIGSIPNPVGRAVAAVASLPIVFKGAENSIISMTKAAAAAGDSVYVMSRGFQMSIADTGKFSTNAKVAGADVMDLANSVKRVQQQIVKGGDDSRAAEWLKRYGESAYNASGGLKDLNEMTFALSRALKKAQADGKGMDFVLSVFRNISADAITAIEDIEAVNEQAKTIVKNGLANPVLAHEVQGNINAMNEQAGQMNAAFESALLPVANEVIPRVTERMGKMTTLIKDNKDIILDFGRDLASVWSSVENAVDKVADGFSVVAKLARENRVVRQTSTKDILEKYKDDATILNAKDLLQREIDSGGYTADDKVKLSARGDLYQKELNRADQDLKELTKKRREEFAEKYQSILEKYKSDKDIKTMTDLLNKLTDAEKELISQDTSPFFKSLQEKVGVLNLQLKELIKTSVDSKKELEELIKKPLSGANASAIGQERQKFEDNDKLLDSLREARKYRENAQAIIDKLNLNDYQKQLYDRDKWVQEQLPRDAEQSLEKYQAVMEEYKAQGLQIEQERADKLREIRDSVAAADKTALENKLDTIEKERSAWVKAGMDEEEATELAQKKIAKAYEDAAEKVQQYLKDASDIEYSLTHSAFEKQIRDIELWEEAQKKKAETAEEIAAIVKNAAAREAEAFEREVDRIKGLTQNLEDEIFEMENSQYEVDRRRAYQKAQKALDEGVDVSTVQRYLNDKLAQLNKRASESKAKDGDYTKSPEGARRGGNAVFIEADQIFGNHFMALQQRETDLMTDENRIRAKLLPKLDASAQAEVEKIQSAKELVSAQQDLISQAKDFSISPPTFQGTPMGSATIIEGDEVTQISPEDAVKVLEEQRRAQEILSQAVAEMPVQELQQFDGALQQVSAELEQFDSTQKIAEAQSVLGTSTQALSDAQNALTQAANNLPPEYFKALADGTKAVSEMQLLQTKSTLDLLKAQDALSTALRNLPISQSKDSTPNDGFLTLSTSTQELSQSQDLLNRKMREVSDIPSQSQLTQPKDNGYKFGFDWDVASGIAGLGSLALSLAEVAGVLAPHPAIKAGALLLGGAIGIGAGVGTMNKTLEERGYKDDALKPYAQMDLSQLVTPLGSISDNVQSILQSLTDKQPYESDRQQELFGSLPNIAQDVNGILLALQTDSELPQETLSFETLVTPLNNIQTVVGNILTALNNRQPPQITVAPNNSINLGGAYVFDNELKNQLVNDITSEIVDKITSAVESKIARSNYAFGA